MSQWTTVTKENIFVVENKNDNSKKQKCPQMGIKTEKSMSNQEEKNMRPKNIVSYIPNIYLFVYF